uniref:Uncharacterized protein n=1 Tax=Rangifer tarandus platyrhynchus TaxID=3082113 RepID=A0ACB0E8F1_RANTA|nr:unnamed protein product [Rangifer tarandus platyrhynchus]
MKSQGLDVQSKRPLRYRALSLLLAHSMDMVYLRCCCVLRWRRTDKAQSSLVLRLGLEGRGWRVKPPRPGQAVVQGELAGAWSGNAGSPPYPAREHSCPGSESRCSPQASKAPPVPPGPAGGELRRARQVPKNTAASPTHRHDDGAEALRPTPHPGHRELLRGKNAPFLIRKERGPDGCYTCADGSGGGVTGGWGDLSTASTLALKEPPIFGVQRSPAHNDRATWRLHVVCCQ